MLVNWALDERPLSLDRLGTTDYNGRLVLAGSSQPLLRLGTDGRPRAAGARRWTLSHDMLTIELDPTWKWSDGAPVLAEDVGRSWRAVTDEGGPYAALISGVAGWPDDLALCTDGRYLAIRLDTPTASASYWAAVLAEPALSALDSGREKSCGPFLAPQSAPESWTLAPNPEWPGEEVGLRFILIRDPVEAIAGFDAGELDATCPLHWPLGLQRRHRSEDSGIIVAVRWPDSLSPNWCRSASGGLQRDTIAQSTDGWLHPWPSLVGPSLSRADQPPDIRFVPRRPGAIPDRLRLRYADYPPNNIVAAEIRSQIEFNGGNVEVRGLPFRDFVANGDTSGEGTIELVAPLIAHPAAALLGWWSTLRGHTQQMFGELLEHCVQTDEAAMAEELLLRDGRVTPIGALWTRWLSRDRLSRVRIDALAVDVSAVREGARNA